MCRPRVSRSSIEFPFQDWSHHEIQPFPILRAIIIRLKARVCRTAALMTLPLTVGRFAGGNNISIGNTPPLSVWLTRVSVLQCMDRQDISGCWWGIIRSHASLESVLSETDSELKTFMLLRTQEGSECWRSLDPPSLCLGSPVCLYYWLLYSLPSHLLFWLSMIYSSCLFSSHSIIHSGIISARWRG